MSARRLHLLERRRRLAWRCAWAATRSSSPSSAAPAWTSGASRLSPMRIPKFFDLRADPFERGEESFKYNDWFIGEHLPPVPGAAAAGEVAGELQGVPAARKCGELQHRPGGREVDAEGLKAAPAGGRANRPETAPIHLAGNASHSEGIAAHPLRREHRTSLRYPPRVVGYRIHGRAGCVSVVWLGRVSGGVVSRIEESRRQFLRWATWKNAGGTVEQDPEAAEIDDLIAGMPAPLKQTLLEVYLRGGGRSERAGRPGFPENMIARRLGQADRLLQDQLSVKRALRRRDADAARMALRLQAMGRAKSGEPVANGMAIAEDGAHRNRVQQGDGHREQHAEHGGEAATDD